MLARIARHNKALLYLSLLLRLLVLSIVLEPEETACAARTNLDYTWREITDFTLSSDWCRGVRLVILAAYLALWDRWGW